LFVSCRASVPQMPNRKGMARPKVVGRAISTPSTRKVGAQASTSISKLCTAGSMPSRYRRTAGSNKSVQTRKPLMNGTGSSWVEKKQHSTAAIIGAAAPDGQPVRIQKAQQARVATAAAADSSGHAAVQVQRAAARRAAGARPRAAGRARRRRCAGAGCGLDAEVDQRAQARGQVHFDHAGPVAALVDPGRQGVDALRSAAPRARSPRPSGLGPGVTSSAVHPSAPTPRWRPGRAAPSGGLRSPETTGTNAARRSCSAFTAFSVQRRCEVSNGRWWSSGAAP
jgi:hypothetical protein